MTAEGPAKDAQYKCEHWKNERGKLVGAASNHVDDQRRQPQAKNHTGTVLL
jgi:hypothetical protein